jgi:type IV secretion system protein TrbJ
MTRGFRPNGAHRVVCAALLLLGLGAVASPAEAQLGILGSGIVFDPTNFARNVLHYARRLEQMAMQRTQLEEQLTAMRKLANPSWRDIGPDLAAMDALLQQGEALGYTLRSIDTTFQQTFPGAHPFQNYPAESDTQATRTLATLRGALDASNRGSQDVTAGLAQLTAIKGQVGTIGGHEEALELNSTIGVYSAEELMLLRQAVAALTNVEAVYYAKQVNGDAQEQATVQAELSAMSAPGPSYAPISLRVEP